MKLGFIFPGQGSQTVGMLDAWQENEAAMQVMAAASASLDQDLGQLIAQGPAEDLNLTTNTQPVMLAASYAMYQAWLQAGGQQPAVVAGHSLGEYTALVAANALSLEDAVPLVRVRANAMQQAVPVGQGAMAAILGLSDDVVLNVCEQAAEGEVVEAVNFNAPSQVVIAGHKAAVERACALAKEQGARRAMLLPVSAPFHSSLLKPAAEVLKQALAKISLQTPAMPVVNNVDVAQPSDEAGIKDALIRQSWHAVRWVEAIQQMQRDGVTHLVECGPGKVLTGLVRRIDKSITLLNINDPKSLQATLQALQKG